MEKWGLERQYAIYNFCYNIESKILEEYFPRYLNSSTYPTQRTTSCTLWASLHTLVSLWTMGLVVCLWHTSGPRALGYQCWRQGSFFGWGIVVNQPNLTRHYRPKMWNGADPVGSIGPGAKGPMIKQPNKMLRHYIGSGMRYRTVVLWVKCMFLLITILDFVLLVPFFGSLLSYLASTFCISINVVLFFYLTF